MKKSLGMTLLAAGLCAATASADIVVRDVTSRQRYPWNGLVDVTYKVRTTGADTGKTLVASATANDRNTGATYAVATFPAGAAPEPFAGRAAEETRSFVWDMAADAPGLVTDALAVTVTVSVAAGLAGEYVVIDLSGGPSAGSYPVTTLAAVPAGGWTDEHKTTKLVLRKIPRGTFTMGSPSGELGRYSDEVQHEVTLTQDFYMGVFQVTQKQWERVMGTDPSAYKGDARPVEQVSYNMIRGATTDGINWPDTGGSVRADTFLGRIRAKTGLMFDLPTEAQREYACRAGTATALNSGKNLTATALCPNMAEVGRYYYNSGYSSSYPSDGKGGYTYHTKVGMYLPNAWGLYDMHGNMWEWCLDWYVANLGTAAVTDPKGPVSGSNRIPRGGGCGSNASSCRSACRNSGGPGRDYYDVGFRLCVPSALVP